jgi:cell wall-associated NlpC family hydrolase
LTFHRTIVRRCLIALIACCLLATMLPVNAVTAESGIPAGSGAVITAGAPLAVRSAPGWDAPVSYEIADGSYVTVWDSEQVAPDGSLWYPVDGGFVPVDTVSSVATLKGGVALYQDAPQNEAAGDEVAPAPVDAPVADPLAADPATAPGADAVAPDQGGEPAPSEAWVEPAAPDVAPEAASNETLPGSPDASDPGTGAGTDPAPVEPAAAALDAAPVSGESLDPATDAAVDPATGTEDVPVPVDTAPGEVAASEAAANDPVPDAPAPAAAPGETSAAGGTEPWGEPIATAYVTGTGGDGAPCLAAPQWGAATLGVFGEGAPIAVRAQTQGEWQPVNCAGVGGYVHVTLIAWTPVGASDSVAEPAPDDNGGRRERDEGKAGGGDGGNNIVDFAMRYEGHPYVYAGEGTRAFDCFVFTMFVIKKTLGIDITHDMAVQFEMGSPVRRNALQPGDLVFFKNTFRRGLSHTGIYIGGGQFIHAENESTGVRISDLDSEYYSSRWYGAVRFS